MIQPVVDSLIVNSTAINHGKYVNHADLVEGALIHSEYVRADKIYTLANSIAIKKFGKESSNVVD